MESAILAIYARAPFFYPAPLTRFVLNAITIVERVGLSNLLPFDRRPGSQIAIFRMIEIDEADTVLQKILFGIPSEGFDCVVHVQQRVALVILALVDDARYVFGQYSEALLALSQRLFGSLALGQVGDDGFPLQSLLRASEINCLRHL